MLTGKFKTKITSKHKLFDLHLRETYQYRDLIFLFVRRDFVAKYKQTFLGPLWAVIQPLLTTVVFTIIFGSLAGLTTADIPGEFVVPGFLFYMVGTILWGYFASNVSAISGTFLNNRGTMGKVYYPRLVAPISTAFTNLIAFAIQFAMMIVIWLVFFFIGGYSIQFTPMMLLVLPALLETMILSIGIGLIVSAVTTKYRDLQMLVGFGLSLIQYACPIAYGLTLITTRHPNWEALYMLINPMSPIITTFRYGVLGFGYFNGLYYGISWAITVAIFFIGLLLFSRTERTFMDTI